eukprot:scpid53253/ scgid4962/ 
MSKCWRKKKKKLRSVSCSFNGQVGSWSCEDKTTNQVVASGGFYNPLNALISSPLDPQSSSSSYMANVECLYTMTVVPDKWILLYFTSVDLPNDCSTDFITVHLPNNVDFVLCGASAPYEYFLFIQEPVTSFSFESDTSVQLGGFTGFITEIFADKRRSPSDTGMSLIKRAAEAHPRYSMDVMRRNSRLFGTWVNHLKKVTNDISSRAAQLGIDMEDNTDDEEEDEDTAKEATGDSTQDEQMGDTETATGERRGSKRRVVKKIGPHATPDKVTQRKKAEQKLTKAKADAMVDLASIVKVRDHCGEETYRIVRDVVDVCIAAKN